MFAVQEAAPNGRGVRIFRYMESVDNGGRDEEGDVVSCGPRFLQGGYAPVRQPGLMPGAEMEDQPLVWSRTFLPKVQTPKKPEASAPTSLSFQVIPAALTCMFSLVMIGRLKTVWLGLGTSYGQNEWLAATAITLHTVSGARTETDCHAETWKDIEIPERDSEAEPKLCDGEKEPWVPIQIERGKDLTVLCLLC